jgi:hypothetical protein
MTIKPMSVWIGFDPRETAAFMVAREASAHSIGISRWRPCDCDSSRRKDLHAADVAPAFAPLHAGYA